MAGSLERYLHSLQNDPDKRLVVLDEPTAATYARITQFANRQTGNRIIRAVPYCSSELPKLPPGENYIMVRPAWAATMCEQIVQDLNGQESIEVATRHYLSARVA